MKRKVKPKLKLVVNNEVKDAKGNPRSVNCNRCGGVVYGANRNYYLST